MRGLGEIFKTYTAKELIQVIDRKFGLGSIERFFASNWFNPFYTLYLNLRRLIHCAKEKEEKQYSYWN